VNLDIYSRYLGGVSMSQGFELLLGSPSGSSTRLESVYDRAAARGVEILLATAFLTSWPFSKPLSSKCSSLLILVGTNFGLTRIRACKEGLKWVPSRFKANFRAVGDQATFHPKILAWREKDGGCYLLIGSSNLTEAGFNGNWEADVVCKIQSSTFSAVNAWMDCASVGTTPISEDWLTNKYREAKQPFGGAPGRQHKKGKSRPEQLLELPKYGKKDVEERRFHQKAFNTVSKELEKLIRLCAKGQKRNHDFYEEMLPLWRKFTVQSIGFERTGRSANWREICGSVVKILDHSRKGGFGLDGLVRSEIDTLAENGNQARGAWLSEILSHFIPEMYPVLNNPVWDWLKQAKYESPRGASQGARYIDLALKLRNAVHNAEPKIARNVFEADGLIWAWKKRQ
jgi:hypothetical protein